MRFIATAKIKDASGNTRKVSGPVEHPSPSKGRVRVDTANHIGRTLADGETVDADSIDVRRARPGE